MQIPKHLQPQTRFGFRDWKAQTSLIKRKTRKIRTSGRYCYSKPADPTGICIEMVLSMRTQVLFTTTALPKRQFCLPVRGGLTLREALSLMEIIYSTGRLRAVDLVEINPALGDESDRKRTIDAGLAVLRAALGFSRKGRAPKGVKDLPIPECQLDKHKAAQNIGFFQVLFGTIHINSSRQFNCLSRQGCLQSLFQKHRRITQI